MSSKRLLINHIKNIWGWHTRRKIIVFSVDDYGNVRVDSKKARENMNKAGLKTISRFDAYDTLETREDLEILFECLNSVMDKKGRNAVLTPFAVPCNINFERLAENNYKEYVYELVPETYKKLSASQAEAYEGAWPLWQEGVSKGLLVPQFHGREHFNLNVFEEKLANKDFEVLTALKNRSYTSISKSGYPTISTTAAFDFWKIEETKRFDEIISSGINSFANVYGYQPVHFNAPGSSANSLINKPLFQNGIRFSDNPFAKKEHLGQGKYKLVLNYTGKKLDPGLININRNVVFEPGADQRTDWVQYAMKQIEIAFTWNKPAVVSSHRVNFCGHIEPRNRTMGIASLKALLNKIIIRWPDVEFMSSSELCEIIAPPIIHD